MFPVRWSRYGLIHTRDNHPAAGRSVRSRYSWVSSCPRTTGERRRFLWRGPSSLKFRQISARSLRVHLSPLNSPVAKISTPGTVASLPVAMGVLEGLIDDRSPAWAMRVMITVGFARHQRWDGEIIGTSLTNSNWMSGHRSKSICVTGSSATGSSVYAPLKLGTGSLIRQTF